MFVEFCLPEMIDLSLTFGSLGMHCCASAEHQFPSFREIPKLYGFNRVAAQHGYQPILELLGGPHAPVHVLTGVSTEETERLMHAAPKGTRFIFNLAGATLEDAEQWLDRMHQLSPRED